LLWERRRGVANCLTLRWPRRHKRVTPGIHLGLIRENSEFFLLWTFGFGHRVDFFLPNSRPTGEGHPAAQPSSSSRRRRQQQQTAQGFCPSRKAHRPMPSAPPARTHANDHQFPHRQARRKRFRAHYKHGCPRSRQVRVFLGFGRRKKRAHSEPPPPNDDERTLWVGRRRRPAGETLDFGRPVHHLGHATYPPTATTPYLQSFGTGLCRRCRPQGRGGRELARVSQGASAQAVAGSAVNGDPPFVEELGARRRRACFCVGKSRVGA
jgi:hypothetical protein